MRTAPRIAVGMLGIAATVLLHSLLFAVAIWGGSTVKRAQIPDAVGAGANSGRPEGDAAERLIVIRLSQDAVVLPTQAIIAPHLAEPQLTTAMLEIRGPDALPLQPLLFDAQGESVETSDADLIARTKLAGLYEGQIRARIERAWMKPDEAPDEAGFSCRARIRQREDGSVNEVELERCNGTPLWQQSLVNAIFTASPLPAPPHPGVFVDTFSLVFLSARER